MAKYQQVEYIESTGTQYINTNFLETNLTTISCHLYNVTSSYNYLYGNSQNSAAMMYNGLYNNNSLEYNWQTINYDTSSDIIMSQYIKDGNNIISINNQLFTRATGTSNNSCIYIFACNDGGRLYTSLRLYYFTICDNNILVRNYIPCYRISDGVIGLFDNIENKFYTNAGSGTFTKGPDITTNIGLYKNGIIDSAGIVETGTQVKINPLNYINANEVKEV